MSWRGRPIVLRHCVYSRYANLKTVALVGLGFGQGWLGHGIGRLGQLVHADPIAIRRTMELLVWMTLWFLLVQATREWVALAFKTMEK